MKTLNVFAVALLALVLCLADVKAQCPGGICAARPSVSAAPSFSRPTYAAPTYYIQPSFGGYVQPTYYARPAYYPAPVSYARPVTYSQPSFGSFSRGGCANGQCGR